MSGSEAPPAAMQLASADRSRPVPQSLDIPFVLGLLFALQGAWNVCFVPLTTGSLAHVIVLLFVLGVISAQPILLACATTLGPIRWIFGLTAGLVLATTLALLWNLGLAQFDGPKRSVFLIPVVYSFSLVPFLMMRWCFRWEISRADKALGANRFQFTLGRLLTFLSLLAALCSVCRWSYVPMDGLTSISAWLAMLVDLAPVSAGRVLVSLGGLPCLVGILTSRMRPWRRALCCIGGFLASLCVLLCLDGTLPSWEHVAAQSIVVAGGFTNWCATLLVVRFFGFRLVRWDKTKHGEGVQSDGGDGDAFSPVASPAAAML